MIQIRATDGEADLEGTPEDLQHIRAAILRLVSSSESSISFEACATIDPTPYARMLPELHIVRTTGPMRVAISHERMLVLSGSDESLDRFASWFDFTAPTHKHHEHFPGTTYIAADSVPLVISARAQQALAGDACKATRA
jgi:hypothetical protein